MWQKILRHAIQKYRRHCRGYDDLQYPDIIDGITEYCEKVKYQILLTNLRLYKKYNDYYYHRTDYYGLVDEEIRKLIATQVEVSFM